MADKDAAKAAVLQQIEFYLSDSNLPRDKYLMSKVSENADGFVALSEIAKFKRVAQHGLSVEEIAEALGASEKLVVSEDKLSVRRSEPLPEKIDIDDRSLHVKGLNKDESVTTIESVGELFKAHGAVLSVRLRRKDGLLRGDAFVEFSSVDEAKTVMTKEIVQAEGTDPLAMQMKMDWLVKLKAERQAKKEAIKAQKAKEKEMGGLIEVSDESLAAEIAAEIASIEGKATPGCVLKLSGIPSSGVDREHIQAMFEPHGNILFVKFSRGDIEAHVLFSEPVAAAALAAVGDVVLAETTVAAAALTPEEDAAFYAARATDKIRRRIFHKGAKGFVHTTPESRSKSNKRSASDDDAAAAPSTDNAAKKQKTLDGAASASAAEPAAAEPAAAEPAAAEPAAMNTE